MTADLGPAAHPAPATEDPMTAADDRAAAHADIDKLVAPHHASYVKAVYDRTRPEPTDRIPLRPCHTTAQHHHIDGLEADLRDTERTIAELRAEVRNVEFLNAELAAQRDQARAELRAAQELIADCRAFIDRPWTSQNALRDAQSLMQRIDDATSLGSPADRAQDPVVSSPPPTREEQAERLIKALGIEPYMKGGEWRFELTEHQLLTLIGRAGGQPARHDDQCTPPHCAACGCHCHDTEPTGGLPLTAPTGCDDCTVEPGERHRYPGCPGNLRALAPAVSSPPPTREEQAERLIKALGIEPYMKGGQWRFELTERQLLDLTGTAPHCPGGIYLTSPDQPDPCTLPLGHEPPCVTRTGKQFDAEGEG